MKVLTKKNEGATCLDINFDKSIDCELLVLKDNIFF